MNIDRKWLAAVLILLLLAFAGGAKYEAFKFEQKQDALKLLQDDEKESGKSPARSSDKGIITVYVIGEVKRPGVYRLQEGDRVYQAVEMAGGNLKTADLEHVDMARKLVDGENIEINAVGEIPDVVTHVGVSQVSSAGNHASGIRSGGLININTATAAELDTLDGIGPTLAQRIIDYRTANGPFTAVEDINNVSGIGDKKYEAIKNSITVR